MLRPRPLIAPRFAHLARAPVGVLFALALAACQPARVEIDTHGPTANWPQYGGSAAGLSYSPLTQITAANVKSLALAWEHRSGDFSAATATQSRTSFGARPIVPNDTLYYCTAFNNVIALDPESGAQRWRFDAQLQNRKLEGPYPLVCRGVSYWSEPSRSGAVCEERILTATLDSELIALDAQTGEPCASFGNAGRVNLREGIGKAPAWETYTTSPPLVLGDLVVVGSLVSDNLRIDAPSGVVRAFDARTGALRWAWDPVPPGWKERERAPGEPLYTAGTPNAWSILSGDAERGLVFVPTGNPSPDLFNAIRQGLDYYGSSVVALRADTGEVAWHYQTVHDDVWDYDVPAQPTLFQSEGVGGGRPGVIALTKHGFMFLLDRESGQPLYPVEERPAPQGGVPGEALSATQPWPTHPGPLVPTSVATDDAFGFTPIDRADCRAQLARIRNDGLFTPPTREGSIVYPGTAGGPNWGGTAIDEANGVAYVNSMRAAMVAQLVPREEFERLDWKSVQYPTELYPMAGAPYGVKRGPLLSSFGAPCVPPPWGTLAAVDLKTGQKRWEVTLGTTRDQAPFPLWFDLGAPNLGGTLATAGGVVFIGATTDKFVRAFDARSGKPLWRYRTPYTANATPMTFRLRKNGKQFVVIAAGGHGWSEPGDALLAFALPGEAR
ncbi:MAG: pyrroloquinoline quinone-dependent dehydrogenase [Myxococcota bacterium]